MTAVYPPDIRSLHLKRWYERCDRCDNCYLLTEGDGDSCSCYRKVTSRTTSVGNNSGTSAPVDRGEGSNTLAVDNENDADDDDDDDEDTIAVDASDIQMEVRPTEIQEFLSRVTQRGEFYYVGGSILAKGQGDYYDHYEGDSVALTADDLPKYRLKVGDRICHECNSQLRQLQLLKAKLSIDRYSSGDYIYRVNQRTLVGVDHFNCAICDCDYDEANGTSINIGIKSQVPSQAVVIFCGNHSVYDQICFMPVKQLTAEQLAISRQVSVSNETEFYIRHHGGYVFPDSITVQGTKGAEGNGGTEGNEHKMLIYGDIDVATTDLGPVVYFTDLAAASDYLGCRYTLGVDNSVCSPCLERLWSEGRLLAVGYL